MLSNSDRCDDAALDADVVAADARVRACGHCCCCDAFADLNLLAADYC